MRGAATGVGCLPMEDSRRVRTDLHHVVCTPQAKRSSGPDKAIPLCGISLRYVSPQVAASVCVIQPLNTTTIMTSKESIASDSCGVGHCRTQTDSKSTLELEP